VNSLRFLTVLIILSLCAMPSSNLLQCSPIQETKAQTYYDYYIPYYIPYSSYGSYGKYTATISVSGLPSNYSTNVMIDGKDQGTVAGGASKQFQVTSTDSHTFQVDNYVSGASGVRYSCSNASWTLQKSTSTYSSYSSYYPYYYYPYYIYYYPTYPTISYNYSSPYSYYVTPYYYYPSMYYYPYYYPSSYVNQMQASHTFSYLPEYMLTVSNSQGQSVSQSGWKSKDTTVSLSTPDRVDKSNVERNIFKSWNIDGTEMSASTITLTMNNPHTATATYQTQYYLDVKSDLDSPQGSGWYNQGDQATVSVVPEVSMTGFWGSLGAKHVFDTWSGTTGSPNSPTSKVTMDKPITVTAMWKPDYTTAYLILAAIIIIIILLIFVAAMAARKTALQPKKEEKTAATDTLNLRYTKGEITREDYLKMKKDIEKS
jgi:hypothetical protein